VALTKMEKTRTHFSFRVDTWAVNGESIAEQLAGVEDYQVAPATFPAACERWPETHTLRHGTRVIEDGDCRLMASSLGLSRPTGHLRPSI